MPEPFASNRHHYIVSEADALPPGQIYPAYVCYADWTDGHSHMMHAHPDTAEILLILKGQGQYSIGLHRYPVAAGDVILCDPDVPHDEFPQTGEPYQTLCVGVKRAPAPDREPYRLLTPSMCPVFRKPEQFDDLAKLFLQMERHAAEKQAQYQTICAHLLFAALGLLQRMTGTQAGQAEPAESTVYAEIERYINTHFSEDLSIEQISRKFFISPYHLSHIFKQRTGCSPKQYILRRRIGEAQTRLCGTKDTVQRIAADVGFEDANYFSRLFAKYVGMSPAEYRNFRTEKK